MGKEEPKKPLLVDSIQGMRAQDHLNHVEKVLKSYGKTFDHIVCLVGDNSSVNQCMDPCILNVPLIGCASHKFNLAVRKRILQQAELTPIVKKVASAMKKASILKIAALLRELTSCCAV